MEKKGRCNRGFVVHSRKGIILIIGVVFSLILLSAFVPLGLTRSKQDIIISTSSHDRIIDLRKGAKVENEVWPCSKDRKVTEEELLSGKYWQCRFSQRNPYSPKDRIPAKAGLDEFPSTGSVKIAIVSDQGMSQATRTLLQQIRDFEPDLVIQNGDFDYKDDPQGFIDMIDDYLPISVPFLAVIGNHDVKQYPEYQSLLKKRLEKGGFQEACFGFIGVHYLCNLYGVLVTSSPAGTIGTHFDSLQIALHQSYQDLITTSQSSKISKWRICSFHKLMNDYQVGIKPDESGYEIYETCRKFGAMIVNGHEHSYSRTKNMVSYPDHSFDDNSTSMLHLKFGLNFAVVTGMGGYGRNPATKEARANPWWASIAAYDDEAMEGALYCTLHSNQKGKCQFKDISGKIWDQFEIINHQ